MPDALEDFDIDDPILPKWIRNAALTSGGYPYDRRMDGDDYAKALRALQCQLVLLGEDMLKTGRRIIMVFEGRDAAGKGGAINAYLQHLNPRYNLHVALPKPNDREHSQWYFQRYVDWFPAASESVLFDRSWYNRAGVEPVMGFCTPQETDRFLKEVPHFERMIVNDDIHFFKFWLSIGREMQMKRFHTRHHDPLKVWKISPIDREALPRWDAYTAARDVMLEKTSTDFAPWTTILANDKRRARLNIIRVVLDAIDFKGRDREAIGEIDPRIVLSAEDFLKAHIGG